METLSTNVPALPVMDFTGERMVPEKAGADTFWEHIYRYRFARRHVVGKDVLDIACGEGYGTAALAKAGARSVIGVDISEETCAHARRKYGVDARCGSGEAIPLPDRSTDVVVSFETIEHVPDPQKFLAECCRVLRPGGQLIISTPNKGVYRENDSHNPFHCSEMTEAEFVDSLRRHFRKTWLYTQRLEAAAWWSLRSLATPTPPLRHVRGYYRLRSWLPEIEWMRVDDQTRRDAISLILAEDGLGRRIFNPFAIHRRSKLTRERPQYLIADCRQPLAR
jgi:2-polyprenyl-3-methyl-5-hydroxy-6-metoxy-1,4-benzoquinol methylase